MKLISVSVKRPVATLMLCVGVVLLGIISLKNLDIDLLPNLSYPKLSVITEYSGASAEEIEKFVTEDIESAFSPIPGVKKVTSVSREGISLVTLEFHWGTDMNFALLHTKEKVEEMQENLPEDLTARPRIIEWDPSSKPIIIAVLKPDARNSRASLADLRESAEFLVKPRLEQLAGVSRVEVQGSGEREVVVSLNPDRLAIYGITYNEVAAAIQNWNQVVLGGTVKKDKIRFVVKVEGEIKDPAEIDNIPIRPLQAGHVLIRDIGKAEFLEKQKQGEIRFNRTPTVGMMIYREASGNTVEATRQVRRTLDQLSREFQGIDFEIISEEAGLIVSAISNLKQALIQGGILAFLVLLIFFQNFRDPLLVAIVSPISVLATFMLMFFAGVNLNIMSLGGLALGIGIFMDNAIVVIENMFRLNREKDAETAAIAATVELVPALLGSTLTTVVIFLPVIYIYGITGRLFRDQSLTISFALMTALLFTVTVLPSLFRLFSSPPGTLLTVKSIEKPVHKNKLLKGTHGVLAAPFAVIGFIIETVGEALAWLLGFFKHVFLAFFNRLLSHVYRLFNRGYDAFAEWYHGFLIRCLDKKSIAFWITLAMLAGTIFFYFLLKKELLPQPHTARFEISIVSRSALGFEETEEITDLIEGRIKKIPQVGDVFSRVGATSTLGNESSEISVNRIDMIVSCRDRESRDPSMQKARDILSGIPDIEHFSVFPEQNTLSQYLRFGAEEFQVKVYYEAIADGKKMAEAVCARMKMMPELADVRTNTDTGKPILSIRFNEDLLQRLQVGKREIAEQVRTALRGDPISTLRKVQRTYDIVVSTPIRDNKDLDQVLQMKVKAGQITLPLNQLVTLERAPSIKEINRESQERFFTVSANLKAGKSAQVAAKVEKALRGLSVPAGVRTAISGEEEERRIAFNSVTQALLLAIILVYMVMAAEFENLVHPLIIMSTVPMGLFGAFVALFFLGETINVISGIGMMVAVGIVVDDAIVKIECANQLRESGLSVRESLIGASKLRLKPIVLNTFTTVFGVFPMIYMSGVGTELQKPMAVVMFGSLISSTFLTLILIPVLYEMVTREKAPKEG